MPAALEQHSLESPLVHLGGLAAPPPQSSEEISKAWQDHLTTNTTALDKQIVAWYSTVDF